jgi:sirohydrochlorin cobaltochelatase
VITLPTGIPIRRRPGPDASLLVGPGDGGREGLLLVGHGSRCRASEDEMHAIGALVAAARPELAVGVGFLEMTDPPAGRVLDALVASGCRRVVVLPLMLLGAGHGKNDVPAIVVEGRLRHPDVDLRFGSPLGVTHELLTVAGHNVADAGGGGLPLLVVARGTSDPDANAEAAKAARLVAEWTSAPFVHTGFTGVTWPLVPDALAVFEALGVPRLALFFWFLCNGRLVERARADVSAFVGRTGIEVVDAGYLGPDPGLVPRITTRYDEAVAGRPVTNCDTCSYRLPFPGLADRVGQPVGVGHSHLAAEHRHGHDGHGDPHHRHPHHH